MRINFSVINFGDKPRNYSVIDNWVSRSAQPNKEDLVWLKSHGVTDIFNFRTMHVADIEFDEKAETELLGMRYHSIPSITRYPSEKNIDLFLKEIEEVKNRGGKAHIHCKAGADRTGMYAFIYEMLNGVGTPLKSYEKWFNHGYHYKIYPNLMKWTEDFLNKLKK